MELLKYLLDFFMVLVIYETTFSFNTIKLSTASKRYPPGNQIGGIFSPVDATSPNIITKAMFGLDVVINLANVHHSIILLVVDGINGKCIFMREKNYLVAVVLQIIQELLTKFFLTSGQEWSGVLGVL
uniref:Uncharacterized protein n=1 Tax=Lepeophtheirus salmonis TaxID=72036 RepID=A0A0K2UUC7_LEPSM